MVRYRCSTLTTVVVVSLLVGAAYCGTAPRWYQAKVSLLLVRAPGDAHGAAPVSDQASEGLMPTYQRLVSSAAVLDGAWHYLDRTPCPEFQAAAREQHAGILRANLSATVIPHTNIMELAYRSQTPRAAVAVVNAVSRSYLEFIDRTHQGPAAQIVAVIAGEKAQLEQRLAAKEQEVLEARRRCGDLQTRADRGTFVHPHVQRAIALNETLIKTQQTRVQLEAAHRALIEALQRGEDPRPHLVGLPDLVGGELPSAGAGAAAGHGEPRAQLEKSLLESQAELKTLQEYYGPAHPRVVALQDRIRITSGFLAENRGDGGPSSLPGRDEPYGPRAAQWILGRLNDVRQREAALQATFDEARATAVNASGDIARLEILEHDLQWLRNLRDVLLNQIASVNLRADHGDIRASVVGTPTLPTAPIWPDMFRVGAGCLVAGLIAGMVLIWMLEMRDGHFGSPEELQVRLGTQLLAALPEIPHQALGFESLQTLADPGSTHGHAFRSLCAALETARPRPVCVAVSSIEPADDKTTVLMHWAVTLAHAGNRTLIIDADLRRAGLTELLEHQGAAGLSDVLTGADGPFEIGVDPIRPLPLDGLDFLPAGTRRHNATGLLASDRLTELLAWAESRYETILIDTPAGHASLIGPLADGLVVVVCPHKNQRRQSTRIVEGWVAEGVNLLGVIANRIGTGRRDKRWIPRAQGVAEPAQLEADSHEPATVPMQTAVGGAASSDSPQATPGDRRPIVPRRVA